MHTDAWQFLTSTHAAHEWSGPVLEVGSIDINGSPRTLWGNFEYTGVDIVPGPNVDIITDIRTLDPQYDYFRGKFHTIICTEVLEHTEPHLLVPALFPLMAPHCQLVITCAGPTRSSHSADGAPTLKAGEYYANVSPDALLSLLMAPPAPLVCVTAAVTTNADSSDVYAYCVYEVRV